MPGTRQTWQTASTEAGKFVQYPANLAGVLCRGREVCPVPGKLGRRPLPRQGSLSSTPQTWQTASTEAGKFVQYPVNLAGVPDALIFFCFLFFHQGKKMETIKGREEEPSRKGREISEKRPRHVPSAPLLPLSNTPKASADPLRPLSSTTQLQSDPSPPLSNTPQSPGRASATFVFVPGSSGRDSAAFMMPCIGAAYDIDTIKSFFDSLFLI